MRAAISADEAPGQAPEAALAAALGSGGKLVLVEKTLEGVQGYLVIAAEFATARSINDLARDARGLVCLALHESIVDNLRLPLLPQTNRHRLGVAYTVSIEAREGVTTGISAQDRALTVAAAIREGAGPEDLGSPGHVFPIRVEHHETNAPRSAAAGAVRLCQVAGLRPAAVICAIMTTDGAMAGADSLFGYAAEHRLPIATLARLAGSGPDHSSGK